MDDAIDWAEVLLKRTFTKGRAKGGVGGQTIDEMMRGTFHEVSAFELEGAALEITALRARLAEVTEERNVQNDLRQIAEDAADELRARLEAVEKDRNAGTKDYCALMDRHDAMAVRAERAEAALATARRDALEEAAKICDCRDREKDDSMYLVGCIDASQANAKRIRALANEAET